MSTEPGNWGVVDYDYIPKQAYAWIDYYQRHHADETPNGPGSTVEFTKPLVAWLPEVVRQYQIESILDAPCGNWNWMQHFWPNYRGTYIGWDVHPIQIVNNRDQHGGPRRAFELKNLLTVPEVYEVDLIICRDFFFHLSNDNIALVLRKFFASGSRYLLTTTFPGQDNAYPAAIEQQGYLERPLNVEKPPICLGGRLASLEEAPGREMVLYDLQWKLFS